VPVAARPPARALALVLLGLVGLLSGCGTATTTPSACQGVPVAAPFDERVTTTQARNLAVRYVDGAAVVTVAQPFPGGAPRTVVLTRCGHPDPRLPADLAAAPRIATPVRSLFSASSTHLPMLDEVGRLGVVTGVGDATGIVSPAVRAGLADHRITTFAGGGSADVEAVLGARPDVLVTGGVDDPAYPRLAAAGIPVVPDAEWLEPTPLGRAEWVKLFGLLTGTEDTAARTFDGLVGSYDATRGQVAGLAPTPLVAGQLTSGTFAVPSGGSYVGALLRDAGGSYPWQSRPETGSLRLSLEEVLAQAGTAPVWITNATTWTTRADALRADPRHGLLAAMGPGGRAWTASLATTRDGGNDYFERGEARPDLVLGDLAAILHPDRFPGHPFVFYRELS
jgi:iron complex transport system substrate-binding protein